MSVPWRRLVVGKAVDLGFDSWEQRHTMTSQLNLSFVIVGCSLVLICGVEAQSLKIDGIDVSGSTGAVTYGADSDLYYILDRLELASGATTAIALGLGSLATGQLIDSDPLPSIGFYQLRGYPQRNPIDSDLDGMDDVYELKDGALDPLNASDAALPKMFDGEISTELDAYLNNYEVGRGMHDVTGVAAEGGMMGYAEGDQMSSGIHDRQWARAFIIRDRRPPHLRVVFVVVDAGQVFQSISQGVHDKIRADNELKDFYAYENIILSATHTHGGAGGHAHHLLFNLSIGGYSWRTYDAMVHGIYMAIKKAHRDLEPGSIHRNRGHLVNANENRRPNAFDQNIEHSSPKLGNPYELENDENDNRDTEMLSLRFEHKDSGEVAMFNWFPVHGVSVSKENTLITGDNKGNAAYLFEQEKEAIYPGYEGYDNDTSTFVAGFVNSNPGDLTANLRNLEAPWPEHGEDDYGRASTIGSRQFAMALALHEGTTGSPAKVTGSVDYRHRYVDFNAVAVDPPSLYPYNVPDVGFPYTNSLLSPPWPLSTCVGALGFEFAKGTLDGEALSQTAVDLLILLLPTDFITVVLELCHYPKDIILTTAGLVKLTPHWLPISILKVGDIVILGVPAEFTVMAGWRLRKTVENAFAAQGQNVRAVLAGLSNSYAGYVTTYEEYIYEEVIDLVPNQGYEAASTHFGAFTLAAYQTHFAEMASSMAAGTETSASPNSVQMPTQVRTVEPVVIDGLPLLDGQPPDELVAATFHEAAGCPAGQLHDLPSGDCFSCPAGYNRQLLLPISDPNVCEKPPFSEFNSATEHAAPGCPVGQFFELLSGDCWSCPAGFNQSAFPAYDPFGDQPTPNGCHKPATSEFTAALSEAATGGTDCPSGYVYDFLLGRCYKCPAGYTKGALPWNNSAACEKEESTSANSQAGSGIFGTDCPAGYVYDFGLARCYICPSGYTKHALRAWNAGNACVKTVTTGALNQAGSGGTDCPSGYVYDFGLGMCYTCPAGFNKNIFRAWNHSGGACEKIIPEVFTSATRHGSGICPSGQFLDIGEGTCWSCPAGFNRTAFSVIGSQACEKINPAVFAGATIHGKFACEDRDSNWFLDIGLNQCWSCPAGTSRNAEPVDGGEACNLPRDFGELKSVPQASYSKSSTAEASFWAGHPKNIFGSFNSKITGTVETFLQVQRKVDGQWETVRTDADWDTTFEWERTQSSAAATIKWVIPGDAESGTYRIFHKGYWGDLFGVTSYSGTSPEFLVTD